MLRKTTHKTCDKTNAANAVLWKVVSLKVTTARCESQLAGDWGNYRLTRVWLP